jgi:hypothetical protein
MVRLLLVLLAAIVRRVRCECAIDCAPPRGRWEVGAVAGLGTAVLASLWLSHALPVSRGRLVDARPRRRGCRRAVRRLHAARVGRVGRDDRRRQRGRRRGDSPLPRPPRCGHPRARSCAALATSSAIRGVAVPPHAPATAAARCSRCSYSARTGRGTPRQALAVAGRSSSVQRTRKSRPLRSGGRGNRLGTTAPPLGGVAAGRGSAARRAGRADGAGDGSGRPRPRPRPAAGGPRALVDGADLGERLEGAHRDPRGRVEALRSGAASWATASRPAPSRSRSPCLANTRRCGPGSVGLCMVEQEEAKCRVDGWGSARSRSPVVGVEGAHLGDDP